MLEDDDLYGGEPQAGGGYALDTVLFPSDLLDGGG